ncbi:MAG: hypothetical protein HY658_03630 [Actinobacteria bacterium]|nr:hypothetical protein [Actinomycetota bacterium]
MDVRRTSDDERGFGFEVTVGEGGSRSVHQVTLSRADHDELGAGSDSPEAFVESCFRFLLDREPKESILSRFDVRDIGRYFPEFRDEILRPR